jgi:hypothetical protein
MPKGETKEKRKMKKRTVLILLMACAVCSCVSTGPAQATPADAPRWVTDKDAAYPNSEWFCYVAIGEDKGMAENAAIAGLARIFNVNIQETMYDSERFAQVIVSADRGRRIEASTATQEFARELISSTNVSGLIGVQIESWAASNGKVYANARMNRRECSARYAAMIRENERLIEQLQEEAQRYPATFDAVEMLNFAFNVAQVTDNFHRLLTVLDPSVTGSRPRYGNADMVNALARNAARLIVITVKVEGDVDGRIAGAFGAYFTRLGFSTNTGGANAYTLSAVFTIEDYDVANPARRFVQYLLTYSLANTAGLKKDFDSDYGRESGLTREQARQRAIRAAEDSIDSTGFAEKFGAYLASLL